MNIEIALRQLNRKLGDLSEKTVKRIEFLESARLNCLTEDLLALKSFDDLVSTLRKSEPIRRRDRAIRLAIALQVIYF